MSARTTGPFAPVAHYLPHRPPMLLLDEIVEWAENHVVCRAVLRPDCVFAVDGQVHASAMIEFVAQACALYVGLRPQEQGAPRMGMIMGCREMDFFVDSFAVGEVLTIVATRVYGHQQVASFTGTVSRGDTLCASLQLSVVEATAAQASFAAAGDAAAGDAAGGAR